MERTFDEIVRQTRDFVHGAGFDDVVVGLSGGIDSSVVAALAVEALGASHVHGVLMPGPYSTEHSVVDAEQLAANLGIKAPRMPITRAYDAFVHVFADANQGVLTGLAAENTQARCRMVILMALSNAHRWLVLNTGNRSEAYMGYSTLYGDTAGAFAPIGGLLKTQVYMLARVANARAEAAGRVAPIPTNVLTKAPSAELAPGQVDEASMGIDYPTLDGILAAHLDRGLDAGALVKAGFDAEQVSYVLGRAEATAFKRALEPPFAVPPALNSKP